MTGPKRKITKCVVKTFRFSPDVVEDMEKVITLAHKRGQLKYPSMTAFLTEAITRLTKQERGELEAQGVAWDHITSQNQ